MEILPGLETQSTEGILGIFLHNVHRIYFA